MDEEALVKIFDLYSSALFNYALRLCGDPVRADHFVGDVFSKLLEQIAAGNGPTSNVRSYLYEMAYHQIVDEARRSKRTVPLEMADSLGQETHSAFSRLEDEITFKQVLHLLQTELTVDQRHVIVLRFLEGFSIRETAAIMGKTVEHVKVIQNRAITALRGSIERGEVRKATPSPRVGGLSKAFGI
jgi:RNA polymerase sigma-70 factor, ECF subfamily